MIGLDTNVLLRFLTQDDPVQSPIATGVFRRFTAEMPGYLCLVVLVESVGVMRSSMRLRAGEIADAIEGLLQLEWLILQNADEVHFAMLALREGTASFEDALIGELSAWAGCKFTYTFDVKASRRNFFRRLEQPRSE
jgi:predicted nucleic-acid-binding protein